VNFILTDNSTHLFVYGFKGHNLSRISEGEYLNLFGLINLNWPLYDTVVARFLSPDPYIQSIDNAQSLNRYSYCLNNPLKYTDPSGYSMIMTLSKIGILIKCYL